MSLNPLSAKLPTNCLSVFDHFVKLALKVLIKVNQSLLNGQYGSTQIVPD